MSSPEGPALGPHPQGSRNPHEAQLLPLLQEVPAQTAVPEVYITDSSSGRLLGTWAGKTSSPRDLPQAPWSCSSQNLLGFPEEVLSW